MRPWTNSHTGWNIQSECDENRRWMMPLESPCWNVAERIVLRCAFTQCCTCLVWSCSRSVLALDENSYYTCNFETPQGSLLVIISTHPTCTYTVTCQIPDGYWSSHYSALGFGKFLIVFTSSCPLLSGKVIRYHMCLFIDTETPYLGKEWQKCVWL